MGNGWSVILIGVFLFYGLMLAVPAAYLFTRKDRRVKAGAAFIVLFTGFFFLQHKGFEALRSRNSVNLKQGNQCPWISYAGFTYILNKVLLLDPSLQIDLNNETCLILQYSGILSHVIRQDNSRPAELWQEIKNSFYGDSKLPRHYLRNTPLVFELAMKAYVEADNAGKKSKTERELIKASVTLIEELIVIVEHQTYRIDRGSYGGNPLNLLAQSIYGFEDKLIADTLLHHVRLEKTIEANQRRLNQFWVHNPKEQEQIKRWNAVLTMALERLKVARGGAGP